MLIKSLELQNFRSFSEKKYDFSSGTTVILGKNTAGKTNTLEAIYFLSNGKSFRAGREEEMIRDGETLARVGAMIEKRTHIESGQVMLGTESLTEGSEEERLEVVLLKEQASVRTGKRLSVNGVSRRQFSFVGNLKVVLFGPWDLNLIVESPSTRRKFMDMVLSQVNREYRRSLLSYEKGVRQRNRVLERIREGDATRSQLLFWNQLLVREGNFITDKREEFVEFVNATPSVGEEFSLEYDRSTISEARLEQYAKEEVAAASTLVGPHRDDIVFQISKESFKTKKNLNVYGSRGEQRMAVLWVKLAELSFVEKKGGERPVLLLDDIFSELDPAHHDLIMETTRKQQTILTTAEPRATGSWGEIDVVAL